MAQPAQGDLAELVSLVSGVARACLADAGKLRDASQALHRASRSAAAADPSTILSELQQSFQALAQSVLLIREETDRLQTIARAGFPAAGGVGQQ